MNIARLIGYYVSIAAAALLVGCSGSAMPNVSATPTQQSLAKIPQRTPASWMSPLAKAQKLLYVSSPKDGTVYVFTYPGGKPAGLLTGFVDPLGLCSDKSGNVWVSNADYSNGYGTMIEYAHGGSQPIATLTDDGSSPQACSVDSRTGNLAVADLAAGSSENIAIWAGAQGSPTYYSTVGVVEDPATIAYDGMGNVYFGAWRDHRGWLASGSASIERFTINPERDGWFAWDGKYLAIGESTVLRYQVSGPNGKKTGAAINLDDVKVRGQFWIQGNKLAIAAPGAGSQGNQGHVYIYNYPQGGNPIGTISGLDQPYGITVSVSQ